MMTDKEILKSRVVALSYLYLQFNGTNNMLDQTGVIREAYEENLMEFVLFCDKEDYGLLLSYYGKHVIEPLTDEDHEVKDSGDISALLEYTLELQEQYRAL